MARNCSPKRWKSAGPRTHADRFGLRPRLAARSTGNCQGMVALASLLIILALGLLITRVATGILEATGMSKSAARFQARSAFTGSGFTTRESESVVDHPVRRKVIMWLMLRGNAGIVAAAGSLIIGFRGSGSDAWRLLELGLGLLCFVFISRSRWVDRHLTRGIAIDRVRRVGRARRA